jgi:hypothetical protein
VARSRTFATLLAVTATVALAVSTTPAAPTAAATVPHRPAAVASSAAVPVPVSRRNPLGSGVEYEVCLYNSFDWCLGAHFDAAGAVLVALDELGRAGSVIIVIEWLAKRSALVAKIVEVLGKLGGGRPKALASSIVGQCIGAWGPGQDVHPGSCGSAHGIYWQFPGDGRVWNTYVHGDMVTTSPGENQDVWVLRTTHPGDYEKWDDSCISGCEPLERQR